MTSPLYAVTAMPSMRTTASCAVPEHYSLYLT